MDLIERLRKTCEFESERREQSGMALAQGGHDTKGSVKRPATCESSRLDQIAGYPGEGADDNQWVEFNSIGNDGACPIDRLGVLDGGPPNFMTIMIVRFVQKLKADG